MGIITGLGWLFSGVLKFFPGAPTVVVYALAAAAVIGLPAGYAYHKGSQGRDAAVARCESACTVKIASIQTAAERTILDIVTSVDEAETGSKDVQQYCQKHPTLCRGEK